MRTGFNLVHIVFFQVEKFTQASGVSTQTTVTQGVGKKLTKSLRRVKLCVSRKRAKKDNESQKVEPVATRTRSQRNQSQSSGN